MVSATDTVVTINCGSTSARLALFGAAGREWSMHISGIGPGEARISISDRNREADVQTREIVDHDEALRVGFDAIEQIMSGSRPGAIGHRMVFGGAAYVGPVAVTQAVERDLGALVSMAPLHMPASLMAVEAARLRWPRVAQVACFDTMFHASMPVRASMMALPRILFDEGLRRYGFHGLSFEYIAQSLNCDGVDLECERVIIAHLGAGASMVALERGRSIETSMGFSTLAGLPMATRCGDLDPGAIFHLLRSGHTAEELEGLLYQQAGLLGVSGFSGDMQDLLSRPHDPHAVQAVGMFCYQARRWLASLAGALGGLDRVVFTGGVGVNAPAVREGACAGLGFIGVELDLGRNQRGERRISSDDARVLVEVRTTDEEAMIERHVRAVLGG